MTSGHYCYTNLRQSGISVWLIVIDGFLFRDANPQWEQIMGNFVQLTASLIEPCLARNGGPVILAQVCCICSFVFVY